jgi:hypothetical protein
MLIVILNPVQANRYKGLAAKGGGQEAVQDDVSQKRCCEESP